jgi:adenosylcobinamide-phosphate synthase
MRADARILAAALVVDAVCGEPPAAFHPVVWMGRLLDWLEKQAPRGEKPRLAYGLAVALALPAVSAGIAHLVEHLGPWPLHALALKPALAGRALLEAGQRVETALANDDLAGARAHVRWLVSRPTQELDGGLVAAAAVESLAENLVDSWVAPLLAYTAFGLSGAYAYRAANTADAMWAYRSPRYEHLGKGAARLDDLLNWVPARLGAWCLVLAAGRQSDALAAWDRDGGRTASPNAGQPMAAAAGALGVRLEKVGHYVLNDSAPPPSPRTIAATRRLVGRAMLVAAAVSLVACQLRSYA